MVKKKVVKKKAVKSKVVKKKVVKRVASKRKVVKRAASKRKVVKRAASKRKKKTSSIKKDSKRVPSGIKNLDKIIEGGFKKNSTNLLVGGSGSGKSIFALQFIIEGIKKGENVLYIAFEEQKDEFYSNMKKFGWELEKLEKEGKFSFLSYTPEKIRTMLEEGGGDIETVVLSKGIQRVVMDSITTFVMLFNSDGEMRAKALALFSLLRSWTCTSLLIYERDPLIDKRSSSRILEFEADSLIFLYFARLRRKRERFLEVYKMRGTNHSRNVFAYDIKGKKGIKVSSKPYSGNLDSFRAQ